jgi:membrane associated rhomboid family serine protease
MFLPIRTDSPLRHTPYMNWGIIVATFLAFAFQKYHYPGQTPPPYMLNPRDLNLAHFLTYQFLHGDGFHIFGNMLFLYIFGNNVNDKMGNLGYLAFYLAGGVMAGIAHVLTSASPVLGASGSVAAVTGAYLVLLPRSHITIVYFFILIGVIEIQSLWFVLIFFAKDVFYQMIADRMGTNVAHMAHIGGTLFGFGTCIALLAVRLLPRDLFDILALMERWNRRRQHRDAVSRGYDPFGYTPRSSEKRVANPHLDQIQDLRAEISESIAHHKLEQAARIYLQLQQLDPQQVLARQAQLDVANQLFVEQRHQAAADAYEQFLKYYSKYDQVEQIQLMLGLIYARYLNNGPKAREHLEAALRRLHSAKEIELAQTTLASLARAPQEGQPPAQ